MNCCGRCNVARRTHIIGIVAVQHVVHEPRNLSLVNILEVRALVVQRDAIPVDLVISRVVRSMRRLYQLSWSDTGSTAPTSMGCLRL